MLIPLRIIYYTLQYLRLLFDIIQNGLKLKFGEHFRYIFIFLQLSFLDSSDINDFRNKGVVFYINHYFLLKIL